MRLHVYEMQNCCQLWLLKVSSQGLDYAVESSIFKLIFSYGLIKKWLLPEFASRPVCLNQVNIPKYPNILLMVVPKNSVASA